MTRLGLGLIAVLVATSVRAQPPAPPPLKPELAGLSFLVGRWDGGHGQVAETGGTSAGRSTITVDANGGVLLRRDHTDLFDKAGAPAGGFDQVMMIYPDGGAVRADYSDGAHVIHYASAVVEPGRSAAFDTAPGPGPAFRLVYTSMGPGLLGVTFSTAPPGGGAFHTIATGVLQRAR